MTSIRNTGLLAVALVICALLAIASAPWALNQPALNFVFKPLATLIVMVYAWPRGHDTPVVRRWVLTGLCFSLAGDVFLMWPQQGFLPGLVSFLLAHRLSGGFHPHDAFRRHSVGVCSVWRFGGADPFATVARRAWRPAHPSRGLRAGLGQHGSASGGGVARSC